MTQKATADRQAEIVAEARGTVDYLFEMAPTEDHLGEGEWIGYLSADFFAPDSHVKDPEERLFREAMAEYLGDRRVPVMAAHDPVRDNFFSEGVAGVVQQGLLSLGIEA